MPPRHYFDIFAAFADIAFPSIAPSIFFFHAIICFSFSFAIFAIFIFLSFAFPFTLMLSLRF
jgi:hypothetical protein